MGGCCSSSAAPWSSDERQDPHGFDVLKDFHVLERLGKGKSAVVRLVKNRKTGQLAALKLLERGFPDVPSSGDKQAKIEVEMLESLRHPCIVRLLDYKKDTFLHYLFLEHCGGGTVFDRLSEFGAFEEADARVVFCQLVSAVHEMREHGVVHRDIKPENVIFKHPVPPVSAMEPPDLEIRVCDFGISVKQDQPIKKPRGTWVYAAPEVLLQMPYDHKVDVWAIGVMLYMMLVGFHAFDPWGEDPQSVVLERVRAVHDNDPDLFSDELWKPISESAKDLLASILVTETKRMSLERIIAHPWVQERRDLVPDVAGHGHGVVVSADTKQAATSASPTAAAAAVDAAERPSLPPGAVASVSKPLSLDPLVVGDEPSHKTPTMGRRILSNNTMSAGTISQNQPKLTLDSMTGPSRVRKLKETQIQTPHIVSRLSNEVAFGGARPGDEEEVLDLVDEEKEAAEETRTNERQHHHHHNA